MIVVKIELWPGGYAAHSREIARMVIGNISDLAHVSDYTVSALETGSDVTGLPAQQVSLTVEGHKRRQSVFALISECATRVARKFNGAAA